MFLKKQVIKNIKHFNIVQEIMEKFKALLEQGICRIYRKLKSSQIINDPMKKWINELKKNFSKEDVQMTKNHMKNCSASLVIKETQIKTH
jgi:hypothetical protein